MLPIVVEEKDLRATVVLGKQWSTEKCTRTRGYFEYLDIIGV